MAIPCTWEEICCAASSPYCFNASARFSASCLFESVARELSVSFDFPLFVQWKNVSSLLPHVEQQFVQLLKALVSIISSIMYVELILELFDFDIEEAILEQQSNDSSGPDTGAVGGNKNNKNQLHLIHLEKEKFIKSNQDKVVDYEESKKDKENANANPGTTKAARDTQKDKDLVALKELLELTEDDHEVEECKETELHIVLDEIITKREEFPVEPEKGVKKGKRRSVPGVSTDVNATAAAPSSSLSTATTAGKPDQPKASTVPPVIMKDTVEKMHENPLFAKRASFTAPSATVPKTSAVSSQFEEVRAMTSFILHHVHDPSTIELDKESSVTAQPGQGSNLASASASAPVGHLEIHHHKKKIVEILAVDLYTNYAKEVLDAVKTDAIDLEELAYKKIVLSKIVVLLKLTKVIVLVEDYIAATLKSWRDLIPIAPSSILQQVENSLREHTGLLSEHRLVRETIERMIESSPIHTKDARVLIDLHYESFGDQFAAKALIHDGQLALLLQFYQIKISLYTLDAKESKENVDVIRLSLLEQRMSALNDLIVQISKGKLPHVDVEKSTTTEIMKMIRKMLQPSREMLKKDKNHHKVYWDHMITFEDRPKAIQNINIFMRNINYFIEKLQQKLLEEHDLSVDVLSLRE
jgi:hypothetical protein